MSADGRSNRVITTTKKALMERVVQRTGVPRVQACRVIQEFLDLIVVELAKGNRLEFRDFGVFELKERAARTALNPRTREKVPVPARKSLKFKAGRAIRQILTPTKEPDPFPEPKPTRKRAAPMS
jgi:integration host factor subunit beta